ncbi:Calcium ion binding [Blomia tropicalis]|nr:Calcium ion binding [Blomia tropicalis]
MNKFILLIILFFNIRFAVLQESGQILVRNHVDLLSYRICCESGQNVANIWKHCSNLANDSTECGSISQLCCLEQLEMIQCQAGYEWIIQSNRIHLSSIGIDSYNCSIGLSDTKPLINYRCCSACRLGFIFANQSNDSSECTIEWAIQTNLPMMSSIISSHTSSAFIHCCEQATKQAIGHTTSKSPELNQCNIGYRYSIETNSCQDINECELNLFPCFPGQSCHNTIGSYSCYCQTGYEKDPITGYCNDINECQLGIDNCHETLRCDNTIGSFHCVRVEHCGTGYTINADRDECDDIDECQLKMDNCGPQYRCRNVQGTFKCDRIECTNGYQLIDGICEPIRCNDGYRFNQTINQCEPIDHCRSSPCRIDEQCINVARTFQCVRKCPPGYQLDLSIDKCTDIDECITKQAECGQYQICRNVAGHYECVCQPGFVMETNRTCTDLNECKLFPLSCMEPYQCRNTIGSFRCDQCQSGYRMMVLNDYDHNQQQQQQQQHIVCEDIDECRDNMLNQCSHGCINLIGTFKCSCPHGFQLDSDNRTCIDVDECSTSTMFNHCPGMLCVNSIGSYQCTCPDGFQSFNSICNDINECDSMNRCKRNETCINNLGSYECLDIQCPPGFRKRSTPLSIQCERKNDEKNLMFNKQFTHYDYLFFSMYNNQTIGHTKTFTIYAARLLPNSFRPFIGKRPQFELRLIKSEINLNLEDYFQLIRIGKYEAKIVLIKPLIGPNTIQLELIIDGIKHDKTYRKRVLISINVASRPPFRR